MQLMDEFDIIKSSSNIFFNNFTDIGEKIQDSERKKNWIRNGKELIHEDQM